MELHIHKVSVLFILQHRAGTILFFLPLQAWRRVFFTVCGMCGPSFGLMRTAVWSTDSYQLRPGSTVPAKLPPK
jgi:hypothetical protein